MTGKKSAEILIFWGIGHKRGFLLGEHGFTNQPNSAKANIGAGFKFCQKKTSHKHDKLYSLSLKKNCVIKKLAWSLKAQTLLKKIGGMATCGGALRWATYCCFFFSKKLIIGVV